ncbi:hypothetical protein CJF30_00008003 [Rutstroemia sp. NJR-2017a BBW]|nr:hypothetical protein CJF30_00008003 [Rutstroemia sp. NJR-2017a BBW]
MGEIKVVNNSFGDIYVSVTATGGDFGKGGSENWYTIVPNGGSETFGNRNEKQVVRIARSERPGGNVETLLGVPGETTYIF